MKITFSLEGKLFLKLIFNENVIFPLFFLQNTIRLESGLPSW